MNSSERLVSNEQELEVDASAESVGALIASTVGASALLPPSAGAALLSIEQLVACSSLTDKEFLIGQSEIV